MAVPASALTNDGYIATNYHVVKDANSIYVQTNKGETLKAYIFAMEPSTDVAILKIENKNFRFGKVLCLITLPKQRRDWGNEYLPSGILKTMWSITKVM